MPAHTSSSAAGSRAKSNGKLLTTAEWRANDLADKLAKRGAANTPSRLAADATIAAAGEALLQSAARLGVVTLAANCHSTEVTRADGTKVQHVARDSTPMPAALARAKAAKALDKETAAAACTPKVPAKVKPLAKPLPPSTAAQRKAETRKELATKAAALHREQTAALVVTASASAKPPATSAAERMAALRARLGLPQTGPPPPVVSPALSDQEATTWTFLESDS